MVMGTAGIGPQLPGIRLAAIAGQGMDGQEEQGSAAAGGKDTALGEQGSAERNVAEQAPGGQPDAECEQGATGLRNREAKHRA